MYFTIKRSTWERGRKGGRFLKANGMSCALGHVCLNLGIEDKLLLGAALPTSVIAATRFPIHAHHEQNVRSLLAQAGLVWSNKRLSTLSESTTFALEVATLNDHEGIEDFEREMRLTQLFEANGHSLRFVD